MGMPDKNVMCHHTGFTRSCFSIVCEHTCSKWASLRGLDPSTGKEVEMNACVDAMMPKLMLEQAAKIQAMSAAMESMRNEIVSRMDENKIRNQFVAEPSYRTYDGVAASEAIRHPLVTFK